MALTERIRDVAILASMALAVVALVSGVAFAASWWQLEQAKDPTNHHSVREYGPAREITPEAQARAEARDALSRQHYEAAEEERIPID